MAWTFADVLRVDGRRCKRCKGAVKHGIDCYICARCGTLPAGLFDPDPTEKGSPELTVTLSSPPSTTSGTKEDL